MLLQIFLASDQDTVSPELLQHESNDFNIPTPPVIDNIDYVDMKPSHLEWSDIDNEPVDVLLLTSGDVEFRSAYKILSKPRMADEGNRLGPVCFGEIGRNKVVLLKSSKGAIGVAGTQATCSDAIQKLNPKVVIGLGVCSGMKKENHDLGDVLVSSQVGFYGPCRINPDGSINALGPTVECNPRLRRLFDGGKYGWLGPVSEVLVPKVHLGQVISGPQDINNKRVEKELRNRYPEAFGREMDAEGMFE